MKKILIFAGTKEGRELSEILSANKVSHGICVATKYASVLLTENEYTNVHCDRLSAEEMATLIENEGYSLVVDATHPYAYEVSKNIKEAVKDKDITYIRLKRNMGDYSENDLIRFFDSNEECAKELKNVKGNILLTTGSKELNVYSHEEELRERLFVRIIPNEESLSICKENGIQGKNISAMQGPFTLEMNEAMIDMFNIAVVVSKQSGINGGFPEKAECAMKKNIPLFVIGCKENDEGLSLKETVEKINENLNSNIELNTTMNLSLIGIGSGDEGDLTGRAKNAIKESDYIFGAKRILDIAEKERANKKAIYLPKDVLDELKHIQDEEYKDSVNVSVLFSGDASFFSGTQKLYTLLDEEIRNGNLRAKLEVIPGISSVSLLASRLGVSYSDCNLYSMHGRKINNLLGKIKREKKMFLLMSGYEDVNEIGKICVGANLSDIKITLGINLSYEDEEVIALNPNECIDFKKEGLIVCLIENENPSERRVSPGMSDDEFIRDKVPMTKEEIREVSICKLALKEKSVLWDIGSGTGSISIEAALLSDDIKVIAIERNEEAVALTEKNKIKFNLDNIEIQNLEAPDGFVDLERPTHAFIGGSKGRMKEILMKLYEINPSMRVVINAVTLETISEINRISEYAKIDNFEILTLQVSKSTKAGEYNLMKADNPVWICSFDFTK